MSVDVCLHVCVPVDVYLYVCACPHNVLYSTSSSYCVYRRFVYNYENGLNMSTVFI